MPKTGVNGRGELRDVAFGKIRTLIIQGVFAPGERLIEDSLGQRLGMSRNPVRESLKMLEREGFVKIEPFRGAFVSQLNRQSALEVFELRELLDSYAARLAAKHASEEHVDRMSAVLREGSESIAAGNLVALTELNSRFHALIHDAAGNSELKRSLDQLRLKVEWMFQGYAATRGAGAWAEHEALLEAIADHDSVAAARIARDHVRNSRRAYCELLGTGDDPVGRRPVAAS